jgi:hypothetical protein
MRSFGLLPILLPSNKIQNPYISTCGSQPSNRDSIPRSATLNNIIHNNRLNNDMTIMQKLYNLCSHYGEWPNVSLIRKEINDTPAERESSP